MTHSSRSFTALILLATCTAGYASTDIALAASTAQRIEVPFSTAGAVVEANRGFRIVSSGSVQITIAPDGNVVSVRDSVRDASNRKWDQSGERALRSSNDAERRARRLLANLGYSESSLGVPKVAIENWPENQAINPEQRGRAIVSFTETVHGYPVVGPNRVQFTFDVRNAEVISFNRVNRWTFDEPTIELSLGAASSRAREILADWANESGVDFPIPSTRELEAKHRLVYSRQSSGFGSVAIQTTTKRLCYEFAFDTGVLFVDAETGECMGGGMFKAPAPQQSPRNNLAILFGCIGTVLGVLIGVLIARKW